MPSSFAFTMLLPLMINVSLPLGRVRRPARCNSVLRTVSTRSNAPHGIFIRPNLNRTGSGDFFGEQVKTRA